MKAASSTLALVVLCLLGACSSLQKRTKEAQDFWRSDEGEWAREVVLAIMAPAAEGEEDEEVEGLPSYLRIRAVPASFEGASSSTGGVSPIRVTAHRSGQIQAYCVNPTKRSEIIYSVFIFGSSDDSVPSGTELWTMDTSEGERGKSRLTLPSENFRLNPVYGPDEKIYFTTDEHGGLELARMDPNGRNYQRLGLDGRSLAADIGKRGILYTALVVGGRQEVRLVEATMSDRTTTICEGLQPRWFGDGSEVLFTGEGAIWKTTIGDSTPQTRVIERPILSDNAPEGTSMALKDPAVSPDGGLIAYASNESKVGSRYNYDIWVSNADGSNRRRITRLESHDDMPQWIDDDTLIFRSNRGRQWGLWTVQISDVQQGGGDPEPSSENQ